MKAEGVRVGGDREGMPVLLRHVGRWAGRYVHVDASARIVDEHASLVSCGFTEPGPAQYHQTNVYDWADGRREVHEFPGVIAGTRMYFDTPRIYGFFFEVDETSLIGRWRRRDMPGLALSELIELSADGQRRARTWHWYKDGELFRRTLIQEERVS